MLRVKRSERTVVCTWAVWVIVGLLGFLGLPGCHRDILVPDLEDLVEPGKLVYDSPDLSAGALKGRMEEVDDLFAEPRSYAKVLASYELCLQSISPVNQYGALWRGARAASWIGMDPSVPHPLRQRFALNGIAFGRESVKRDSRRVEPFYYLARSLAALAASKNEASPKLLREIKARMAIAEALDPTYDACGPSRFLGRFFVETDGYPLRYAMGSIDQGLVKLKAASEGCPEYAGNHLTYARALVEDEQYEEARVELEKVLTSATPPDRSTEHHQWLVAAQELLTATRGK